jgi:hypothetical protein
MQYSHGSCSLLLLPVDLSSWHEKICDEMELEYDDEAIEVGTTVEVSITRLMNLNRFPNLM